MQLCTVCGEKISVKLEGLTRLLQTKRLLNVKNAIINFHVEVKPAVTFLESEVVNTTLTYHILS